MSDIFSQFKIEITTARKNKLKKIIINFRLFMQNFFKTFKLKIASIKKLQKNKNSLNTTKNSLYFAIQNQKKIVV